MSTSEELWLISFKNEGPKRAGQVGEAVARLSKALKGTAEVSAFELPELRVGTLEKLMLAGDQLSKVDYNVEQVVRKIERQFEELTHSGLSQGAASLGVDQQKPESFVRSFRWNAARYPTQRSIEDLVKAITLSATKTEQELKDSAQAYSEKKQRVQLLERQKEGNLQVMSLDDVLTPKLQPHMIHDSEYLKTVPIVVLRANEEDFAAHYEAIGSDIVPYPKPGAAAAGRPLEPATDTVLGSPVVPGSAQFICKDKDGNALYMVTILLKFLDAFKTAAQSAKHLVRDYDFAASYETMRRLKEEGGGTDLLQQAKVHEQEAKAMLLHWCQANFGDTFSAWVHVKAIRVFVESVLRYGLPVNFSAAVIVPGSKGSEKRARDKLANVYQGLDATGLMEAAVGDDALKPGEEELFSYVSFTLVPNNKQHK